MLAASHALVGGAIVKMIPDPKISLPLAFLSHFFLDAVPHWDFITNLDDQERDYPSSVGTLVPKSQLTVTIVKTILEFSVGVGLSFYLFRSVNPVYLASGIIFAQLPDYIEAPYLFFKMKFPPSVAIKKVQTALHSRLTLPWGIITQLAVVIPILWLALR